MNILITEDEDGLRMLVSARLAREGYTIREAANLRDARVALQQFVPDVALLDLNLPDGVGFSLVTDLRQTNPEIRIVVMSAYSGASERERVAEEAIDRFLPKPFKMRDVVDTVAALARPGS